MNAADPRCIVCKGTGNVDAWGRSEPCACTEVPRRDPYAPASIGWVADVLPTVLANVAKAQASADAHAAICTDRPCAACRRFVCRCGKPVDGDESCMGCAAAALTAMFMRPTLEGIPKRFHWAIEADTKALRGRVQASTELVERGLASPPSSGLLFLGRTGAGKTSLAVAMLGAWVRVAPSNRNGARFVEAGWLARARARHRLGQGEAPLVNECLDAPLLVLDDLGSEREDRDGVITDVVYGRHNADAPTWITCGLSSEEPTMERFAETLARRYDGGFVRRILENGKRVQLGKPA